ncbi:MAG: DNA repair protein RecN [Spirochaetaceae bacterium]|nr:DNA repair protein RecN [Spirochaetaceae bacterium]
MIISLTVKNIALIEEVTIDFENGFHVFSGETGAGKSIIIGALGFLLGGKSSTEVIRKDCEEASVSATFSIEGNQRASTWLSEHDISVEDNTVFIRRSIKTTGRSSAWIANTPVARPELEEFTRFLVDIHGQHDHQSLFRVSEHRRFLDAFAGIEQEVTEYSQLYLELTSAREQLEELSLSQRQRLERIEYLEYAVNEIQAARLKEGEDIELETEAKRLDGFEKLYNQLQEANECTSGVGGAIYLLKKALHCLQAASEIDDSLKPTVQRISNQYYELEDACSDVQAYTGNLHFDEARRDEIQERLSLIYKLTKKYCESPTQGIAGVLHFSEQASHERERLQKGSETKEALEQKLKTIQADLFKKGQFLSKKRAEAASLLQAQIETVLKNLNMQKIQFKVNVQKKETEDGKQKAGQFGFDDIEFLISPNLGEPLKPLTKIASGGEISRVMLALKTVLAQGDSVGTLIFDEIDTGIGGEVAISVAKHIKELSKHKQILCVTHLAVIAAHADCHIKIEKLTEQETTRTNAQKVIGDTRIEEIARMLSGDEDDTISNLHAKELLEKYSTV